MEDILERHRAVREMVKDLSLKTKVIAEKTGYNQNYVSELRRRYLDAEARKAERLKKQEEEQIKEQARIERLIVKAVAREREACAKVCDDWPLGRDDVHSIAAAIRARGNT